MIFHFILNRRPFVKPMYLFSSFQMEHHAIQLNFQFYFSKSIKTVPVVFTVFIAENNLFFCSLFGQLFSYTSEQSLLTKYKYYNDPNSYNVFTIDVRQLHTFSYNIMCLLCFTVSFNIWLVFFFIFKCKLNKRLRRIHYQIQRGSHHFHNSIDLFWCTNIRISWLVFCLKKLFKTKFWISPNPGYNTPSIGLYSTFKIMSMSVIYTLYAT